MTSIFNPTILFERSNIPHQQLCSYHDLAVVISINFEAIMP